MVRRKTDSPISLFSFQDVIMSVVGIVILITLILLLQLVSQMSAAPPAPVISVKELRQQIDSLKPVLTELQDSAAEQHRAKELSEIFTPSQEQTDAARSTVERLESDIAAVEKKIELAAKRIDELKNNPVARQLAEVQQNIKELTVQLAALKQQSKAAAAAETELQAKIQELKSKNIALNQQLAAQTIPQLKVSIPQNSDKTAYILLYGQGTIDVIPTDGSPKQTFSAKSNFFHWAKNRDTSKEYFVVYVRPSRFGQQDAILKDLRARGFDVGLQVIGEETDLSINK